MEKPVLTPVLVTEVTSTRPSLSRRTFALSLAVAAPVVLGLASSALGDVWQEYRPSNLPFRVEMPGEPQLETEEDELKETWINSVVARVDYEQTTFGVTWTEWKHDKSIELMSSAFREGMRRANMAVTRETSLIVNGFPVREFIRDADGLNYIIRQIVMAKETIQVNALGTQSIHGSPTVRRFFDSFKLLRSAP